MLVVSRYSTKPSQYNMAKTGLKLICWMESRTLGSIMSLDLFMRISDLKCLVRHNRKLSFERYNLQEGPQPVTRWSFSKTMS